MIEPSIRDVEIALQSCGLSRRQRRALLASGWGAVVDAHRAEADELRLALLDLRGNMHGGTMHTLTPAAVARDRGPQSGDDAMTLPEQRTNAPGPE